MDTRVKKLRFGVMCRGEQLESAFAASIDELLKIDGVELALLIVDENPPDRSRLRDRLRKMLSLKGNLWAIFQWLFPLRRLPQTKLPMPHHSLLAPRPFRLTKSGRVCLPQCAQSVRSSARGSRPVRC